MDNRGWIDSLIYDTNFSEINTINDIINSLKGRIIFIYGAGSFGKEVFNLLCEHGIKVEAFLDKNAKDGKQLYNTPIYRADDINIDNNVKSNAVVLLSIVTDYNVSLEITKFINKCGFKNIINSQMIRAHMVYSDDLKDQKIDQSYLISCREKIEKVEKLFIDEESIEIFKSNIIAHIRRYYIDCNICSDGVQYFPMDINFNKGYKRFIDCGGYIGDTLENVVELCKNVEAAVSFEPNVNNFLKLSDKVDDLDENIENCFIYPCAVSDKNEIMAFNDGYGSGSVSNNGGTFVQSVSIDKVLKSFDPTFIKMDIEGEELKAICGAKNTINKSCPDLAICVYHCINHIWDIPLLLDSWKLGYKFYLKRYSTSTMETVLYATTNI